MKRENIATAEQVDVVVVGAGFAGLYALHKLRSMGLRCQAFEAGSGVGGTWFWNRYPGARCDIESVEYSYSFSPELEQEWDWSERYAAQPEILRYANHVAERFQLLDSIQFNTRVTHAVWEEDLHHWTVRTDQGITVTTRFFVLATGCLSSEKLPEIPGLQQFQGQKFHTGRWPAQGADFAGRRVGVIGTGSSGIQTITELARQAGKLFVFQRTPHYSLPAHNRPLSAADLAQARARYPQIRTAARQSTSGIADNPVPTQSALEVPIDDRNRIYEDHWNAGRNSIVRAFTDLLVNERANETAAEFVRDKVRGLVKDPGVAEALAPRHFIGTKRICLDTGYYESYNRDNVQLVDLAHNPITGITANGVQTKEGHFDLDALVFATGYDAVTGAVMAIDITTSSGLALRDKWASGARCYLGLMSAGFPNLFIITGPGSPSILSNVILSIEHHVDLVAECLAYLEREGLDTIDADVQAEEAWVAHVNELAAVTLYPRSDSWYMGANVPGKPRIFLPYVGGVGRYQSLCRDIVADGWRGFVTEASPKAARDPRTLTPIDDPH